MALRKWPVCTYKLLYRPWNRYKEHLQGLSVHSQSEEQEIIRLFSYPKRVRQNGVVWVEDVQQAFYHALA